MSSQIRFFATKKDLVPVLEAVEIERGIRYIRFGRTDMPKAVAFSTVTAFPNLGVASHESAQNGDTYLICEKNGTLRPREVAGHYIFDQLLNSDTVTFTPGGLWGEEILLHGRFATVSKGAYASELMKLLGSSVRRRFKKIKAFYVGKEAEEMLDGGRRLTFAAQAPRTFDLSKDVNRVAG